jgi:hypothetical protein
MAAEGSDTAKQDMCPAYPATAFGCNCHFRGVALLVHKLFKFLGQTAGSLRKLSWHCIIGTQIRSEVTGQISGMGQPHPLE